MESYITNNPIESVQYPGFYITPVSDKIVVSPMGEFILIDTGRKLHINPITEKTPYPALWIPGLNGRSVHRCLAITFLKCHGNPEEYQVNHISGDKSDYSLNNLEWVSPTEDLIHAFKTELRTDNRKVLAKDLHTGEIVEYYSQAACAKALGVTPATLHSFMFKVEKQWPLKERWDVIRKGDEWSKLTKRDVGNVSSLACAMVITISEDELEINAYDTLSNMAAILDISLSEAKKMATQWKIKH